ncbi:flavodoxin [uncultured Clostridium sp.]|uniref:flavodoxin n=1 Tax=uncultured Clostridium sp. TaxID=59620 RepID=UPI0025FC5DBF|nr:flavodoxin [uncultured Clostridium sp.]
MKIVYYSLSGNTKRMAELIADGIKMRGKDAELVDFESIGAEEAVNEEVIILGCPSQGVESLEESVVEPFVESLEGKINGKKVALFGSYGWGNGEWMKDWEERLESYGGKLIGEGLIINEMPEDENEQVCIDFGKMIAENI